MLLHTLVVTGKFIRKNVFNNLEGLTPRVVSEVTKLLVSLGILTNIMQWRFFAVKSNVVSDIIQVLLNDIFAELDGSSGIKNIITNRLAKSFKS